MSKPIGDEVVNGERVDRALGKPRRAEPAPEAAWWQELTNEWERFKRELERGDARLEEAERKRVPTVSSPRA